MARSNIIAALALKFNVLGTKQSRADIQGLAASVKTSTAKMNTSLARTERQVMGFRRSMGGLGRELLGVRQAFAGFAAVFGARAIFRSLDSIGQMQNRLKSVIPEVGHTSAAFSVLADVSKRTFSDLGTNVEAFQKITLATKDMGLTMADSVTMVENLNKGMAFSGVVGIQAQQAILQLTQAMAKGVLNGDEFRTIQESFPFLLDLIAQKMGKTRQEIVNMGRDQQITREILVETLKTVGLLDAQWKRITPTLSMALNVMNTKWKEWLAGLNAFLQINPILVSAMMALARNTGTILNVLIGAGGIWVAVKGFQMMTRAVQGATVAFTALRAVILTNPLFIGIGLAAGVLFTFLALLDKRVHSVGDAFTIVGNQILDWGYTLGAALMFVFNDFDSLGNIVVTQIKKVVNQIIDAAIADINRLYSAINLLLPEFAEIRLIRSKDFHINTGEDVSGAAMDAGVAPVAGGLNNASKTTGQTFQAYKDQIKNSGDSVAKLKAAFLATANGGKLATKATQESAGAQKKAAAAAKKHRDEAEKLRKEWQTFADSVKSELMTDADKVAEYTNKVNQAKAMGMLTAFEAQKAISEKNLLIDPRGRGFAEQTKDIEGMATRIDEIRGAIEAISRSGSLTTNQKNTMIANLQEELDQLQDVKPVIDEASFAFQGFETAIDGTKSALTDFLNTGKFDFSSFVTSLLQDLNRLAIDKAFVELFGDSPTKTLMGGATTGNGGLFGDLFGLTSNLFSSSGSSSGGMSLGMDAGSMFGSSDFGGFMGFASGGKVSGPGGPVSDSVPAMLSDGEFVVNAAATKKFLPLLQQINAASHIERAAGGPVSGMSAFDDMGSRSGGGMTNHFHVQATDAQSFMNKKTQNQIQLEVAASMRRAQSRLG